MTNHPNRNKRERPPSQTPATIRQARDQARLTQGEAAQLARCSKNAWVQWESERAEASRAMPAGAWDLFRSRAALLAGDETGALAILREALDELDTRR